MPILRVMSIATYVVRPDSVAIRPGVVVLRIGLPWYRSLPWAGIAGIDIQVDGAPCDGASVTIDGWPLERIREREDYWHIQHRATVVAGISASLAPGQSSHM